MVVGGKVEQGEPKLWRRDTDRAGKRGIWGAVGGEERGCAKRAPCSAMLQDLLAYVPEADVLVDVRSEASLAPPAVDAVTCVKVR